MTDEQDPYKTLGVSPDATDDEIRKAFYARARRAHPDVVGESGLDDMRTLNEAWALLKDPDRRAAHDAAHGRPHPATAGRDGADAGGGPRPGQAGGPGFGSQPHWTGAAGPPPGRPWGSVMTSGIYSGWSLGEIARRDRGYLAWLRDRPEGKRFRAEIDRLLELSSGESGSTAPAGKRRKRG